MNIKPLKKIGLMKTLTLAIMALGFNVSILFSQSLSTVYPKNGVVFQEAPIHFKWNNSPGALNYSVVLSQDANFLIGNINSPLVTILDWTSSTLISGLWYWKVIANDGFQSFESNVSTFTIFEPNSVSGNTLWLSADGSVTEFSGQVLAWSDNSSNGIAFAQGVAADQPTLVVNEPSLNNKSVIQFDGNSDFLSAGNVLNIGTNSLSIFLVGNGTGVFLAKFGSLTLPHNIYSLLNIAGFGEGAEIAGNAYQEVHTTLASNYHVINANVNRTTSTINLKRNFNNVATAIATGISSSSYDFSTPNPLLIGKYNSTNPNYLNGSIAEILFYNSNLSTNDRLSIEKYLNDKYAPPVDLGRDTTIVSNFCPITLTAPAGFTNYVWSNGATTSSITVSTEGAYWLSATNLFGVVSTDTIMVNYPTINETINTNICVGSSAVWDPQLGAGYTYAWNTGAVSSSLTINTAGNYSVVVTDGLGCTKNSDTLSFVIDNYELMASLGNDTIVCSGNYIELVSNASETNSYEWQGNSSPSQPSSYQISATGDYWLESTNVNGCVAQDTINVIVSGTAPTAIFSGLNSCLGSANSFTDGSTGVVGDPVTTWSWDFGDGIGVSSAQNPTYSYSSPGSYTVELYALSQGGCGAYYTEQVEVYTLPTAAYTHTGHCSDQVMQFTNQSTVGGATINQYAWNFGQPSLGAQNVSSVQNPYRTFPTGGTYPMTLTVTDAHMCVDDTVMQIVVNATPIIDVFAADVCQNEQVVFTNNTVVETPALYYWTFGDNTNSILPAPIKQYATEGTKTITVKVTAANGCFTSDTIQMTVHAVPVASFDLGPHCKGAYTEVQSTSTISSGTIDDLFWVVNLTDTLYGDTTGYEITSINQQQIQLFVTSDFGCSDEQNLFFDPEGAISAAFTLPSTVVACGEAVAFTNASLGATDYSWSLGNDSTSTAVNPSTTYDCSYQDSTLVIQLIASNSLGCIDTAYTSLFVGEYAIDLQVDNIYFQANGTNAILGAELKNLGTAPLTTIDLDVFSETGFVLHEVWTGTLLPNQTEIYVFSNQPAMTMNSEDDVISYYCIRGTGYSNTEAETDYSNNEVCKNIENSEVVLKPLYPNPTGSTITMGIIVPQSSEIAADLVDDQGRVVKQLIYPFTLESGEYTYVFDLSSTANGTYALRFTVDGKTELHRLVVLH
jgi:PKD repeat protein